MMWLFTLLPYVLSVAVSLGLAAYGYRRRSVPAASAFSVSLIGQAVWAFGYIFELLSDSLPGKIGWDSFQYIGFFTIALSVLVMARQYVGKTAPLSLKFWLVMLPVPLVVTGAALSEPWHHLLRGSAHIVPGNPVGALWYDFTAVDILAMSYLYVIQLYALVLLFRHGRRGSQLARRQTLALILGLLTPLVVGNALVFGYNPFPQRDPAPLVFLAGGLFYAWGLFRTRLFDILPVARTVVFESMIDGVVVVDPWGHIVDINPAASAILRMPLVNILGDSVHEVVTTAGLTLPDERHANPISEITHGLDTPRWIETTCHALTGVANQHRGAVFVFHDVTESHRREHDLQAARDQLESMVAARTKDLVAEIEQRKHTEAELAKSERRFRAIFDQSFQFVGLLAPDGTILDANHSALALVGAQSPEIIGRPFWETPWWRHDPEEAIKLRKGVAAAAQGTFVRFETTHVAADGTTHTIDFSLKPILDERGKVIMMIPEGRDITELKQAQRERMSLTAQLHESQKLESLGRLAGGVAHDFNNLLTVITGNLSLVQGSADIGSDHHQAILEAIDAARRASELTRQLLTFSRRQIIEPRVFDPTESLGGLKSLLPRVVGENITLTVKIEGKPGNLFMDPSQFEQIVMNLVVNARDATPTGGRVDVTLDCLELEVERGLPAGLSAAGTYSVLTVADTGTGIAEADIPRIFEPFFTTKGSGTGLGLATVHGIVTRALGWVGIETSPGQGTTFRVFLPCCEQVPVPSPAAQNLPTTDDRTYAVVVVEDQTTVRDFVVRALKHFGFQVQAFADGTTALAYARVPGHAFDLVLTDVVMPVMDGRALADALRQIRPAMPIVFMSGHTDDTVLRHGIEEAREYFLAKPFTPNKLVAKLRAVLGQSPDVQESAYFASATFDVAGK